MGVPRHLAGRSRSAGKVTGTTVANGERALPPAAAAVRPGGWIVVGTNPVSGDPLLAAVNRWNAARGQGSAFDAAPAAPELAAAGLADVRTYPTFPGGPVLVAARRLLRRDPR
jgi:hypothetical protein